MRARWGTALDQRLFVMVLFSQKCELNRHRSHLTESTRVSPLLCSSNNHFTVRIFVLPKAATSETPSLETVIIICCWIATNLLWGTSWPTVNSEVVSWNLFSELYTMSEDCVRGPHILYSVYTRSIQKERLRSQGSIRRKTKKTKNHKFLSKSLRQKTSKSHAFTKTAKDAFYSYWIFRT